MHPSYKIPPAYFAGRKEDPTRHFVAKPALKISSIGGHLSKSILKEKEAQQMGKLSHLICTNSRGPSSPTLRPGPAAHTGGIFVSVGVILSQDVAWSWSVAHGRGEQGTAKEQLGDKTVPKAKQHQELNKKSLHPKELAAKGFWLRKTRVQTCSSGKQNASWDITKVQKIQNRKKHLSHTRTKLVYAFSILWWQRAGSAGEGSRAGKPEYKETRPEMCLHVFQG